MRVHSRILSAMLPLVLKSGVKTDFLGSEGLDLADVLEDLVGQILEH